MFKGKYTLELFDTVRNAEGVAIRATPEVKKTYFFSELTLQGQETLTNWIRKRHVAVIHDTASSLPDDLRREATLKAVEEASTMSWNSDYGQKLLQCVDGIALIALVCIQQNHTDLTYEQLRLMTALPENFEAIMEAVKASSSHKAFLFAREATKRKNTSRATKKAERQRKSQGRRLKKRG